MIDFMFVPLRIIANYRNYTFEESNQSYGLIDIDNSFSLYIDLDIIGKEFSSLERAFGRLRCFDLAAEENSNKVMFQNCQAIRCRQLVASKPEPIPLYPYDLNLACPTIKTFNAAKFTCVFSSLGDGGTGRLGDF